MGLALPGGIAEQTWHVMRDPQTKGIAMIAIRLSPANRDRIRASIPATVLPDEDLTAMVEEYGNRPQVNAIYFTPAYEPPLPGAVPGWGTIPNRYLQEYFDTEKPIDNMNFEFVKITRK